MRIYKDNTYKSFADAVQQSSTGKERRLKRNELLEYIKSKPAASVLFVDIATNGKPYEFTAEQAIFLMLHC